MRYLLLFTAAIYFYAPVSFARIAYNYSDVKKFNARLAEQHPSVKITSLGQADSSEQIQVLKIGDGAVKNLVVAAHHGNEYGSVEVALAFAESIAKNPIRGQTVFIVPVLNTAGYDKGDRYEQGQDGSYHDPNRDYPGPCGTEGPFKLKSTASLARFVAAEGIVASATLHTYYPAVVYPWGLSTHDLVTPYEDIFIALTKAATLESGYETGNGTEVIYPADGTYEDYAFWQYGAWSLLFELGYSHWPSEREIQEMIRVNLPGLRRMLESAPTERAADHAFNGRCDISLRYLDRHDE